MRRIRSTGCGYSLIPGKSYTCGGVPKLTEMFKTTPTNIFGTEVIRTATSEEYSNEDWLGNPEALKKGSIDNYAQLPQAFEGFVMTLTPILDMDATAAGPEVPELECRINFDPFARIEGSVLNTEPGYTADGDTQNDGFLNLYNTGGTYTQVVYVEAKTKEQLQTESVADSLIYYDMPPYLTGSTVSRDPEVGYIIRPNTDPETGETSYVSLMAGPGILEPMLDTSFPPIGVDTITGPDIIGDFTMWEFNTIAQWQHTVDMRLNNIRIPSVTVDYGKVNGLINLENAKNQDGHCLNFQIQQTSVNPVIQFGNIGADTYPEYEIKGGEIVVDGTTISDIPSYTPFGAIFDAYLDIFKYGETEDTMVLGATITDLYNADGFPISTEPSTGVFQHQLFKYIGSVTQVTNTDSPVSGGTIYTLYEIKQGDCIYEVSLSGGTGGGGSTCSCKGYQGPFKVVGGTVTNQVSLIKFDPLWVTEKTITGYVMNGEYPIPAPADNINISGTQDIWAHIDITAPTVTYYTESAVTAASSNESDNTEDQEEEATDFVDVRIARVTAGDIQYVTVTMPETLPSGATIGTDSTMTGTTASTSTAFARYPVPSNALEHIATGSDVPFDASGTVYEVYGGTLTGTYCVAPPNGTCSYSVYATQEVDIKQIQYGDIVLGSTAGNGGTSSDAGYHGPFTVSVTDGTATIVCDDCPTIEGEDEITGYYSINGSGSTAMPVLEGVAADTGDYVYLQFSTGDPVLSTTAATAQNVYNVLLARVTGTNSAAQLHYGNIHVDGRWS